MLFTFGLTPFQTIYTLLLQIKVFLPQKMQSDKNQVFLPFPSCSSRRWREALPTGRPLALRARSQGPPRRL